MNKKLHIVTLMIAVLLFQSVIVNAENPVEPVKKQRPKIGLVFSGGGAKGFAYIGFFKK
jgi:hypothetical protein